MEYHASEHPQMVPMVPVGLCCDTDRRELAGSSYYDVPPSPNPQEDVTDDSSRGQS